MKPSINSIVIGYGEIGKAVAKVFDITDYIDVPDCKMNSAQYKYMHVAIPYSEFFVDIVNKYINKLKPSLTIIHSTVAIGTIEQINGNVVHMPVRGRHDKLAEGIKHYPSIVGYKSRIERKMFRRYIEGLSLDVMMVLDGYRTTEAAKLLSLLQYGMNIEFARYAKKICDKNNVSYDVAIWYYTRTYNKGIESYNPNLVKTILEPPTGPIGGHCVLPAIKILNEKDPSDILSAILEENHSQKREQDMATK